jgi:hypothetical protein
MLEPKNPSMGFSLLDSEKYDEPLLSNRKPAGEYRIPKYEELVAVNVKQGLKI